MLVLTRKVGEKLILTLPDGRVVTVLVADVVTGPTRVRLATEAPADVTIDRQEVHQRKEYDRQQARRAAGG